MHNILHIGFKGRLCEAVANRVNNAERVSNKLFYVQVQYIIACSC